MQPVAAGVMNFLTPCFFLNACNTNNLRALFRPLNPYQHLWRPGSGPAQEFFGVFWPANEATLGWDFTHCGSGCAAPLLLCPTATATVAEIPGTMTKDLGTFDQEAQDNPFQLCIALQHCKISSPGTGQQLQVMWTWIVCVTPQERMQSPPKNSSRVLCFHFQHK